MTASHHTAGQPFLYRRTGPVSLHLGDARQVLTVMPDASIDCLLTSPPFSGLRDYGSGTWHDGDPDCRHRSGRTRPSPGARCRDCGARFDDPQYGLEDTVEQYVARLVAVFDEARRVLVPSGTCWLNLGDSYSAGTRTGEPQGAGLAAKNLHGVPWRVAFALQSSGWWLRNAVVWAKSNPMPESVRDRLSTTYELLFLLTRSRSYYFDLDPIRIPLQHPEARDGTRIVGGSRKGRTGGVGATARRRGSSAYGGGKYGSDQVHVEPRAGRGNLVPLGHAHTVGHPKGRNPGDVWRIATRPYRGSHVAPFPIDLPLRAIAGGCPPGGVVCDPFSGAGTTGLAALQLGRGYIGVDIVAGFHDEALARLQPHLPDDGGQGR